jgi:hypothetical protein
MFGCTTIPVTIVKIPPTESFTLVRLSRYA